MKKIFIILMCFMALGLKAQLDTTDVQDYSLVTSVADTTQALFFNKASTYRMAAPYSIPWIFNSGRLYPRSISTKIYIGQTSPGSGESGFQVINSGTTLLKGNVQTNGSLYLGSTNYIKTLSNDITFFSAAIGRTISLAELMTGGAGVQFTNGIGLNGTKYGLGAPLSTDTEIDLNGYGLDFIDTYTKLELSSGTATLYGKTNTQVYGDIVSLTGTGHFSLYNNTTGTYFRDYNGTPYGLQYYDWQTYWNNAVDDSVMGAIVTYGGLMSVLDTTGSVSIIDGTPASTYIPIFNSPTKIYGTSNFRFSNTTGTAGTYFSGTPTLTSSTYSSGYHGNWLAFNMNASNLISTPQIQLYAGAKRILFGSGTANIGGNVTDLWLGDLYTSNTININDVLRLYPRATEPSGLLAGMVWYSSTENTFKGYNGSVINLGAGGGTGVGDDLGVPTGLSTKLYRPELVTTANPQGAVYMPLASTGTDGTLYDTTIIITSATIKGGLLQTLLPAPGSLKANVIAKMVIYYDYNTSGYTSSDGSNSYSAYLQSGATVRSRIADDIFESASDIAVEENVNSTSWDMNAYTVVINSSLYIQFWTHTGTGTGTAKLKIWYYIADFN